MSFFRTVQKTLSDSNARYVRTIGSTEVKEQLRTILEKTAQEKVPPFIDECVHNIILVMAMASVECLAQNFSELNASAENAEEARELIVDSIELQTKFYYKAFRDNLMQTNITAMLNTMSVILSDVVTELMISENRHKLRLLDQGEAKSGDER